MSLPSDPRPRCTPSKPVNLEQLAQELRAPLCRNEVTGEIVAPVNVSQQALSDAVAVHVAQPTPWGGPVEACHANSGDRSERVATVAVGPSTLVVALSVPVGEVRPLDLFLVGAEVQATNPYQYNCLFTAQVILATTPDGITGVEVTEANGTNITPGMHHMATAKTGGYQATQGLGVRYMNLVVRADASAAAVGDALTLDADYGRLSVTRIRGASALLP